MTHQIVTANRLIDGAVIYFTADEGWSSCIDDAHVLAQDSLADEILSKASESVGLNVVVDPYLIDVSHDGGNIKPARYREAIRAMGPSTLVQESSIDRDYAMTPERMPVEQIPTAVMTESVPV